MRIATAFFVLLVFDFAAPRGKGGEDDAALLGAECCLGRKIDESVFSDFKMKARAAGGGKYSPAHLLECCIQSHKNRDSLFEYLAQAVILSEFPDAKEAKLLRRSVSEDRIYANLADLFWVNSVVNDQEIREAIFKAARNYFRTAKKVTPRSRILPVLALADPQIDPAIPGIDGCSLMDREILKTILSKQSDHWKCKKISSLNCDMKWPILLFYICETKEVDLVSDFELIRPLVCKLSDECQYKLMLRILSRIPDAPQHFSFQFDLGWARALNGDDAGAEAIFRKLARGPFTADEIQSALESADIIKRKKDSKKDALILMEKIAEKFWSIDPSYFSFKFSCPTDHGKMINGKCLICPGINKVELSIFEKSQLFYYQDTSIFGTRIKNDCSACLLKSDSQVFFPFLSTIEKSKNKSSLLNVECFLVNENSFKMRTFNSMKNEVQFLGDKDRQKSFVENKSAMGFYFDASKAGDGSALQISFPDFENNKVRCIKILTDSEYRVRAFDCRYFSASNIQYGDVYDEKFVEKDLPDLSALYKTKKELNKAAMYLLKFNPEFGGIYK